MCATTSSWQSPIFPLFFTIIRFDFDGRGGCWSVYGGNEKRSRALSTTTANAAAKKMRLSISPLASSALAESRNSSTANFYKEVGI